VGTDEWEIDPSGPGVPIIAVTTGNKAYDKERVKAFTLATQANLYDRPLAILVARPIWAPARLRTRVAVVPESGVTANIEGSHDTSLILPPGQNRLNFQVEDAGNELVTLTLEVEDYTQTYKGLVRGLPILIALLGLNTIVLVVIAALK
jgi:hypothetical protein